MRLRFDPAALVRLILLGAGLGLAVLVMGMVEDGSLGTAALLTVLVLCLLGGIAIMLFRLPLYAFFGFYGPGARLTGNVLEGMGRDTPGRELFLYQHAYFLFGLGRFEEALAALEEIDSRNIPDTLQSMVCLNKGLVLLALFRGGEALATLSLESMDEHYPGGMRANWLAYTAEAHAQLGTGLEHALDMAESGFSLESSPRIAIIMGHILWKMRQFEAANAWLSWGTKRVPRKERYFRSYARFLRAGILREAGESRDAEQVFRKALALAPSNECRELYARTWEKPSPRRKRRQP